MMSLAGACMVAVAALASPALAQSLEKELDAWLERATFGDRLTLGMIVVDGETGRVIAGDTPAEGGSRGTPPADVPVIPASNMKLLTSGVALDVLSPEHEFKTELLLERGAAPGGRDRLIVRGSGDPALGDPELLEAMKLPIDRFLDAWTDALREAGALASVGEIVIDDRVFDRAFVHPSWPDAQLNRWYCAQVAGINFHLNMLKLYAEPRSAGLRPDLTVEPALSFIEVENKAKSVGGRKRHTAWASRVLGSNQIALRGDVKHAANPVEVTVHDPPEVFGRLLAERIAEASGVAPAPVRRPTEDEALDAGEVVFRVRTPMSVALERCNVDSHNLYAEALLKAAAQASTGGTGTWEAGAFVVRDLLRERIEPELAAAVAVADGSGMSRDNRVTPRAIAAWLRSLRNDPRLSDTFIASLPRAGADGTLDKRFRSGTPGNEVRAKTGYLNGVSALSGYVICDATGRTLIFSVISNDKPSNVSLRRVRDNEEELVMILDRHLTEEARELVPGGGR